MQDFSLLCPDKSRVSPLDYKKCNWGEIPSNMIMTSAMRDTRVINEYKDFLKTMVQWFGPDGTNNTIYNRTGGFDTTFELFKSNATYDTDEYDYVFDRKNQLFSDQTKRLEDMTETYFQWVGEYIINVS